MNIKILDSWLREYLETDASVNEIAQALSLCSVGVERVEKIGQDTVYDIEITTNRPDLMSVIGIAREAAVVLPHFGHHATFKKLKTVSPKPIGKKADIEIQNDPSLVQRIMAIVLEVEMGKSPAVIATRLEHTDIRSLNSIVDVTNYVMRETGHPTHVFDYDRLTSKKLIIRESKKGETVVTLDNQTYTLAGGDIIADNGSGEIVDLLGIMGTLNSVVTPDTKRILFFLDNNDRHRIRKTSMSLGIRTEAAQLNEKGVDPILMEEAFLRGVALFKEIAHAKVISDVIDIFPRPPKPVSVTADTRKIRQTIGVEIPDNTVKTILTDLGFIVTMKGSMLTADVPSWRLGDVGIEEDIIEEVARVYGYHNIPSILPPQIATPPYHKENDSFYWEKRIKHALQYWGFYEVYTYSMVAESMYEGESSHAVKIKNPLDQDHVYMRTTIVPSLLEVIRNSSESELKIFEIAHTYHPRPHDLPRESLRLAGAVKKENISFYEVKGYIEALVQELGVPPLTFKPTDGNDGAAVYCKKDRIGAIEILDGSTIDFEFDFDALIAHATLAKQYTPRAIHPPLIEDVRLQVPIDTSYESIVSTIMKQSELVQNVELIDTYEDKKTFRIYYQHQKRNLTTHDITDVRKKILLSLEKGLNTKTV
jgi:phenylalanyl-tRNA synthetase beta chain